MKVSADSIEPESITEFRKNISNILLAEVKPSIFRVDSEKLTNNTIGYIMFWSFSSVDFWQIKANARD